MDRLKHRRKFVRKVGQQASPRITALLQRRHPTVELLWEAHAERWCLVQTVRNQCFLIRILEDKGEYLAPTVENTVYFLDLIHPSNFTSEAAKDRLLAELDRSQEAEDIERRSKEQITEGSKDLYNVMTNRKVLTVHK